MQSLKYKTQRVSLMVALLMGAIGLTMLFPVPAWAGRVVYVAPPKGSNDTANLQGSPLRLLLATSSLEQIRTGVSSTPPHRRSL